MKAAVPITGGNAAGAHTRTMPGISQNFALGDQKSVEAALAALQQLGITRLRTMLSWADWVRPEGTAWYDWLLPTLAKKVEVIPGVSFTPPSVSDDGRPSSPPRDPKAYADFIDILISRYGDYFTHLELWHNPLDLECWDRRQDPLWERFALMTGMAAHWARRCGKKTLLGGVAPEDSGWIDVLAARQLLPQIDAIGVIAPRSRGAQTWAGWAAELQHVRAALQRAGSNAEIWILDAGAEQADGPRQLQAFVDAAYAPADRVYWHALRDTPPTHEEQPHPAPKPARDALLTHAGQPSLLARLLGSGGLSAVEHALALRGAVRHSHRRRPALVTGGAGFIGSNLTARLLREGQPVIVYDSLARPGVELNAAWLKDRFGSLVDIRIADARDRRELRSAVRECSSVFHFAAQVAVTTSLVEPEEDMSVNIGATVALLEELRRHNPGTPVIFTSTNKVYGHLSDVALTQRSGRYEPIDPALRRFGLSEERGLDFCSPYGCSKGAADQYILDYAKTFDIPATVFRMSCIYGPRQWGTEDQGWIAFFLRAGLTGSPITIFGDGRQVRDALFVDDLVDAFLIARAQIDRLSGRAFNIGGGPANTLSLRELLDHMSRMHCEPARVIEEDWRPADQRWYVSDTRAFTHETGWEPKVNLTQGLQRLLSWLQTLEGTKGATQPMATSQ